MAFICKIGFQSSIVINGMDISLDGGKTENRNYDFN